MILDQPENQFYFWPEYNYPEHRKGQNAIFASEAELYPLENGWFWKWLMHQPVAYARIPPPGTAPQQIVREFQSITDLGEHDIKVGDRVFHRVHLWACHNLK
jgi:hypothetical protein